MIGQSARASHGEAVRAAAPRTSHQASRRLSDAALFVVSLVALVLLWEAGVRLFRVSRLLLPAPSAIAGALWRGFTGGLVLPHLWVTLTEVLLGFALGSLAGMALGTLTSQFPLVHRVVYPYIVAFQTMPKVAVAPLFVIWLGFGLASKVVVAALVSFFPLLVNVISGLEAVDPDRVDLMRSLGANRWQIFWMVALPGALPFIFAGLDLAMVFSVIGAIVAEFVGARAGLGYLIQAMNFQMDVAAIFAVLLVLSALGLALHYLVLAVKSRFAFWERGEQSGPGAMSV